jgi:hypothetical protein
MIGHGEDAAGSGIEQFPAQLCFDGEPALFTEMAVQVNRLPDRHNAVLREDQDVDVPFPVSGDEIAHYAVDPAQIRVQSRVARSQALQAVIQMRQVNQTQVGTLSCLYPDRGVGDPAGSRLGRSVGRRNTRSRPPKGGEGELAKALLNLGSQGIRPGIDIEDLPAVSRVLRARGDAEVRAGIQVEPPKQFCAGESRVPLAQPFPDLRRADQMIRLLPKMDLGQVAVEPAVPHDPVGGRGGAGEIVGLCGAGYCWERGFRAVWAPERRNASMAGVCSPIKPSVNPTTFKTARRFTEPRTAIRSSRKTDRPSFWTADGSAGRPRPA